jgi:hypothetical protein
MEIQVKDFDQKGAAGNRIEKSGYCFYSNQSSQSGLGESRQQGNNQAQHSCPLAIALVAVSDPRDRDLMTTRLPAWAGGFYNTVTWSIKTSPSTSDGVLGRSGP